MQANANFRQPMKGSSSPRPTRRGRRFKFGHPDRRDGPTCENADRDERWMRRDPNRSPDRFTNHGRDGQGAPFAGVYLEIVPPERFVQAFAFGVAPFNENAAIETSTFEALDGRTRVHARSRYPSV